jgi:hypothetical protein
MLIGSFELQHGAIVMLYHPCSNPMEIAKLRHIVTQCLRRHVISAYRELSYDRPLALIAWGHRLELNYVNQTEAIHFIKVSRWFWIVQFKCNQVEMN